MINNITITVSGARGVGKTSVMYLIERALQDAGLSNLTLEWGSKGDNNRDRLSNLKAVEIIGARKQPILLKEVVPARPLIGVPQPL